MAHLSLEQKDVRQLQEMVQDSAIVHRPRRKRNPSRASMLELIDFLSRWSSTGLALMAGLSIFLAISVSSLYPARAATWAVLMLSALWVCRRLRDQFRAGNNIAARPFHWRASFTSCLSVLGVIFASAPILLTPSDAPTMLYLQVAAISLFGAFGAAMVLSAHMSSAAAIAVPAAILPALSALRMGDIALVVAITAISAMGLAVTYGVNRTVVADAVRRNPRTSLAPREPAFGGLSDSTPLTTVPLASSL